MPSHLPNYYRILQVDPEADQEVIEAAFKRLAHKYHPDKNAAADATVRMQRLNEAYEVLRDPARRREYDLQRRHGADTADRDAAEAEQRRADAERQAQREAEAARRRAAEENRRREEAEAARRRAAEEHRRQAEARAARRRAAEEAARQHAALVRIEPGTFQMGSPRTVWNSFPWYDEKRHWVRITKPFLLGETEVTQAQWWLAMGTNPSHFRGDNRPVERVSWFDAVAYCNALSDREGLTKAYTVSGSKVTWNQSANGYRLPTESEWEYACRAGTTTRYWSGDKDGDLARVGWYNANSGSQTHDVKEKPANAWGLYGVHGNVSEWCWDLYGSYPAGTQTSPAVDPKGGTSGSYRVLRGGSWCYCALAVRCADRLFNKPADRYVYLGFRVARTVSP